MKISNIRVVWLWITALTAMTVSIGGVFSYFHEPADASDFVNPATPRQFTKAQSTNTADIFARPGGAPLAGEKNSASNAAVSILAPAPIGRTSAPPPMESIQRRGRRAELASGLDLKAPKPGDEASAIREFTFDLFDDVQLTGRVARMERHHPERVVYSGPLTNVPGGDFILAYNDGHLAATFSTPGMGDYLIRPLEEGQVAVYQLDLSRLPACQVRHPDPQHGANVDASATAALRAKAEIHRQHAASPSVEGETYGGRGQQGGDGAEFSFTTLDILIVFTENARTAAGGYDPLIAIMDATIARANSAFINSEVGLRLRMVRSEEVAYSETDRSTSLDDLREGNGAFVDVATWRDTSGADLVSLVFDGGGGRAWTYNGNSLGYSVNGISGIESTFVHEIGHNLGCDHDRENSSSGNVYPYSHGWRFTPDNSGELRSIMAYAPGARIPYFSNPDVTYMGTPTGVPIGDPLESHNAEVIRQTKALVAAFRAENGNVPPSISLTSPVYEQVLKARESLGLAASASDSDGSITEVRFYRLKSDANFGNSYHDSTLLGFDAFAPYTGTEAKAPAGFWTYAAVALDDGDSLGIDTVSIAVAPHYRQSNLSLPAGKSRVELQGINEAGRLVGYGYSGDREATDVQAAYWQDTTLTLLDPLPGDTGARALAVDQVGNIYGQSISSGDVRRAVKWSGGGAPTDLSGLIDGFTAESAVGVDELGRIYLVAGNDYRRFDDQGVTTADNNVRWRKVANTGTYAAGQDYDFGLGAWRALRWEDSGTPLPPLTGFSSSWGRATNRSGAVFGVSSPDAKYWGSSTTRLTFWPAGSSVPVDLGTLGATGGSAYDLNDWNEAVGRANDPDSGGRAVLWKDGELIPLADLVLPEPGIKYEANLINNRGQIAGIGYSSSDQFIYWLDPMPGIEHHYWLARHFDPAELDDPSLTDDEAAPAEDGIPNLLKRALGLDPRSPISGSDSAKLPQASLEEDDRFHFRYRRLRAPRDLHYHPEASVSLAADSWDEDLFELVEINRIDRDYEEVHLRSTFTMEEENKAFGRLRVER